MYSIIYPDYHTNRRLEPLDRGFNVAVLTIANRLFPCGFDVSEEAPQTYEELKAHLDSGKRMVVWSGASETTIYGDPEVNYAFRAWHDWCHWRGEHAFTLQGERAVCAMQQRHLRYLYGTVPRWELLLEAEIIGQFLYKQEHGRYPEDQRTFVERYLTERQTGVPVAVEA